MNKELSLHQRRRFLFTVGYGLGALALPVGADDTMPVEVMPPMGTETAPAPRTGSRAPASLDDLAALTWPELECLYRAGRARAFPLGFTKGRALPCLDAPLGKVRSRVINSLWRGKHFSEGTLINQWRGAKAIRANVYEGQSLLDGQPSIIMDYQETSHVWRKVRDELREIAPGLYVGIMYHRNCPEPKLKMFFALQLEPCVQPSECADKKR